MMVRRVALGALAAAALTFAPAAMADTTATGYGPPGNNQQHHVTKPKVLGVTNSGGNTPSAPTPTNTPVAASTGSLPFTGFDLVLVLATGAGLVLAGFGLRRLTRRESAI
jgi:hypothetical protein